MKKNMSLPDGLIRVLIALGIGALYFTQVISGTLAFILLAVGVIFILTSLLSFCPLYAIFGISTCKKENKAI